MVVDARALRLLLGGVAELLILERLDRGAMRRTYFAGEDGREKGYVWDDDELCP